MIQLPLQFVNPQKPPPKPGILDASWTSKLCRIHFNEPSDRISASDSFRVADNLTETSEKANKAADLVIYPAFGKRSLRSFTEYPRESQDLHTDGNRRKPVLV
jgi:hypothetical protein